MGNMRANAIGLAGEFRVMSELLIRGHNPAKSYLDLGTDIILENGLKIQIKTTMKQVENNWKTPVFSFSLTARERKIPIDLSSVDFLICVILLDDLFYIIPTKGMKNTSNISIPLSRNGRYEQYRNNWELLSSGGATNEQAS